MEKLKKRKKKMKNGLNKKKTIEQYKKLKKALLHYLNDIAN